MKYVADLKNRLKGGNTQHEEVFQSEISFKERNQQH